jgi:hypothetical protein
VGGGGEESGEGVVMQLVGGMCLIEAVNYLKRR